MDWLELARNYGLTGAGLFAVIWFLAKYVWPFFVGLYHEQQAERREERARFIATADAFLESLAAERKAFQEVVTSNRISRFEEREVDRITRIEERERFLSALRDHHNQLAAMTKAQEDFTKVQLELVKAMEKKNGH